MKNTFRIAVLVSMILSAPSIYAQKKYPFQPAGGGGFTIGYGFMDVSRLHDFVPASVSSFSNQHLLIGGSGHSFNGNLVIGGSGSGIIGDDIKTDSFNYSLGGGIGTFDFGYLLVNREKLKFYPMIGIGGGGYSLGISSSKNTSTADIVKNPAREINISRGNVVFDLSVNLDVIPFSTENPDDNSQGGFMCGLRLGYLYSTSSTNWNFSGGDITGGPRFGMNMAYLKLIIGGFGYSKQ